MIKSYDLYQKEEFKKIPSLGTHYTLRWAQKDMKEEKDVSNWNKSENDKDEVEETKDIDSIS